MAKSPTKAMSQALGGKAPAKKASNSKAAPITSVRVSDGQREREVSVRKIDNGYIVRESSYGGKGGYTCSERYTEKPPVLDVKPVKGK